MTKLWIVGCSIAHGVGVSREQRWGEVVGQQLGIAPVFLTAEGSSIEWATDQILQADIKSGDTVLWGVTTPNRFMHYSESGSVQHILNVYYQNHPHFQRTVDKQQLVDLNLAYKAVNYILQVKNFLNKLQCHYAIGYLLPGLDEHKKIILRELSNSNNFFVAFDTNQIYTVEASVFFNRKVPPTDMFIDTGSDGFHPGPKQHVSYAEQFLKILGQAH